MIRLGLTGYPLEHSLSPRLHTAALRACGLKGDYSLFPVRPDDLRALQDLLTRVRTGELTGLNVTIPHKQNVVPLMDELTPAAKSIGAVNTICLREQRLIGDNTDAAGFLTDLERVIGPASRSLQRAALVIGAGGSARAVVYALSTDGWQVTIAARRQGQADELVSRFSTDDHRISSIELQPTALHSPLSTFKLVVNTTPLGMAPNIGASPWPDGVSFPPGAAVYDLVYNPAETLLVKQARAAGLRATTGLGMLVEQAALAFERWTGETIPREVMFDAVNHARH